MYWYSGGTPRQFGKTASIIGKIVAAPFVVVLFIMIAWLVLCLVVAVICLSFPALGIGILLYTQLDPHYPAGVLTTVFAAPGMGIWVLLNLAARLMQTVRTAVDAASGRQKRESFRATAPEQYILLYNRCAVLEFLIWISIWMGHLGLILFLALASAFPENDKHECDALRPQTHGVRGFQDPGGFMNAIERVE
ncbi:MAG: hypothetical protein A3H91_01290 [Gammaproteobacteria bacterium RIFCSPLOWO2_02_FULL_61_13]|nr:MAG: hypothetical protein A3H91_01290 [Gammaproteobacteria bacterium RIFCSPLOWO2_02_FULL_61_13]